VYCSDEAGGLRSERTSFHLFDGKKVEPKSRHDQSTIRHAQPRAQATVPERAALIVDSHRTRFPRALR